MTWNRCAVRTRRAARQANQADEEVPGPVNYVGAIPAEESWLPEESTE